ncbi:MAG: hypothetical protein HZA81_04035 [Candidatus Taylorbacteria bacterium]|nr:hypothetical protein [Candidatus Taylorbacteria bacterium]
MFQSDKKSPLERVQKSLYSRDDRFPESPRHDLHARDESVPEEWKGEEPRPEEVKGSMKKIRKAYSYLFVAAFGFFLVAAAIGGYTLFGGKNFVSVQNVDILIEGPSSVAGGDVLALNVSVVNRNTTGIELVELVAEYPEGTKDPEYPERDLGKVRFPLGDIGSNSIAQKTLRSIMFGPEGTGREIKFSAEYRTAGSNAIFFKEKSYRVAVSSSPVLVAIDALSKVLGGQSSDMVVTVSSNTPSPVKDLLLSLEYPFGFSVVSATPQPSYGNNIWRIGDLAPGAKKSFAIRYSLEGQDGEEKVVRANVGIQSQSNEREIATTIISRDHSFAIERPFLALDVALNGERADLAAEPGKVVRADILWQNNSQGRISGARIEAKLSGNVLDKGSVSVENGGYYDSLSNAIVWEAGRTAGLDSLAPGESGRVTFSFSSVSSIPGESAINPLISVSASAQGGRVDESGAPQEVLAASGRSVKLVSNLSLSARVLRSQGPISNSGPVPPRVDQPTTYTVVWTVTNTSNSITGARVEAALPPYVSWTGVTSPADANISYNPTGGIVTWNVGSVPRNASVGSGAKQVAFQVSFKPSANQVGSAPEIVSQASIVGLDTFTGATLRNSAQSLSTRTSSDLFYKAGDEAVQE